MNVASAQTADTRTENLAGLVERVTFHNEENGFCVLRLKVRGRLCCTDPPGGAENRAGVGSSALT